MKAFIRGAAFAMVAVMPDGASADAGLEGALARIDDLYRRRDEPPALEEQRKLVEDSLGRAPADYRVLWRAARLRFWVSDDATLSVEARARIGKEGWDLAERAVAANPGGVEGHYWAMADMGSYSLGLGVIKALAQGMEAKFRERLGTAERLNGGYDHGGVQVAWGRFYQKLPWPKYDAKKAEEHLRRALQLNPFNLRARLYLAELSLEEGRAREAKQLIDEILAATPGRYDAPEERRAKSRAAVLLPKVLAKL